MLGAGLSGAAHATPAQGGAFGLSVLHQAPLLPVTGATPHTGAGQSLLGGFGRAGFAEDAGGRQWTDLATIPDIDQKTLQHIWFTFCFLMFAWTFTHAPHMAPQVISTEKLQHMCCGGSAHTCKSLYPSLSERGLQHGLLHPSMHPSQPVQAPGSSSSQAVTTAGQAPYCSGLCS